MAFSVNLSNIMEVRERTHWTPLRRAARMMALPTAACRLGLASAPSRPPARKPVKATSRWGRRPPRCAAAPAGWASSRCEPAICCMLYA